MKFLMIVLIVCLAASFNKVQSNEISDNDDTFQEELDDIRNKEHDPVDEKEEYDVEPALLCYCLNGGSPVCPNGRLSFCNCYNGYHGNQCQYGPSTPRPSLPSPSPISSLPCYCYNGGSPVCSNRGLSFCNCYNGYHGNQCQYGPSTPRPTLFPPLTCYSCSRSSSPRKCSIRTMKCLVSNAVCVYGRFTLKSSGRSYYVAGCLKSFKVCQNQCSKALRQGIVTYCSMNCCQRDYCNRIVLSTTREPPTRPDTTPQPEPPTRPDSTPQPEPPTPARPTINGKFFLRLILKLLESFKALIDVTSTLIKAHLSTNDAQFKKREIVSMMKRVDHTAQNLENSRDPEVIKVKRDVAETRMRAKDLIAKLDDYIADEPDKNKK